MAKSEVKLRGWQQDIIDEIESHENKRDSEQYQGLPEYVVNKELSISVAFPRKSGHSFLASYIASRYKSALVYGKTDHYKTLLNTFQLNSESSVISHYEIYYTMMKNDNGSTELIKISEMLKSKSVIVIDNAQSVGHEVKDFILASAIGPVVMLGR